jgi:PAS domain S-box-containing protein
MPRINRVSRKEEATVTKNISKKKQFDDLRRRAEQKIPRSTDSTGELSPPEIQKLIQELNVHQIELEMQNEALRKSQMETLESRNKYSDLYDFAPVGYFTLDGKGHIIEANVTGASLLGAEKRSLAKQPFQRFIIPGHFSTFQSHLQKAHETRSKQICKLRLTGKDGTPFDALIDSIAVKDDKGEFDHYRSSVTDITEITRAEAALRESEHKILEVLKFNTTILNTSSIGILTYKESGQCTYANEAAAKIAGTNVAELLEQNFHQIQSWKKSGMYEAALKAFRAGTEQKIEIKTATTFGKNVWLSLRFSSFYSEDENHLLVFTYDITERKQAEELLRRTEDNFRRSLDESPLGVRIVTVEGETLYANRAILDIYGYDSLDELNATPVVKRYTPESYAEFQTRREKRGRGDYSPSEYGISIVRKDGEVRHLAVFRKEVLWDDKRQFQVLYNDITDRKRAENALILSEYRFKELFENMSSSVAVYEAAADEEDFIFTNFNKAAEEAERIDRKDVIGKSIFDVFPGIRNMGLFEVFQRVWRTGRPEHVPVSLYRDKRTEGWKEHYIYKLPTGEIVTIYNDVTARKKAEDALQESEARFANIFNASPVAIAITRLKDNRLIDVNNAWQKVTGYSQEEVIDRTPFELNTWVNPGERDQLISIMREQGTVRNFLFQLRHKSGTVLDMLMSAELIELAGERYMLSLAQDITERKRAEESLRESEEKYRALVETTDTGFVIIDENGTVFDANENYIRMTGHKALDEIRNRSITEWTSRHDLERNEQAVRKCFDQGFIRDLEISYVNKKGEYTPVDINASVVETKEGRKIVSLCRNITERKLAEEAIKKSHEQLRAFAGRLQSVREEQRKEFAREIHDQLGGAMAGLKIDLSFLASSAPKSWHIRKRDSFLSKVHEMSKLIDETIGTVRRLVTELRPSILDDFGLLAALEWQLWEFQKRTGIQSEFVSTLEDVNIDEELSTAVFRIFQEALTNVARHANATNVIATLYKEADSLVLKVEDNGKGISENDIHNTKSVGLIGMRERALFLGGTVNFSGEPSKGTTVLVQFPFKS